ncbi:MAG: ATP synthase F1 subunit delta [Firmicutes bacterium]|nr:ATP synthase F1 subunit delta [Bacillota bacterium]
MKQDAMARPYARALFDLARRRGEEALVDQHLGDVIKIWDGDPAFSAFIRRPEVARAVKRRVVDRIFSGLDELTRRFLAVLIDKGREDVLAAIGAEFRHLWDEERGIVQAEVTTADALSDDEQAELVHALSQAMSRTVRLTVKEDRGLLGGVVVRIGDRVLDGSLARRLTILGERLRSGDGGGIAVEH